MMRWVQWLFVMGLAAGCIGTADDLGLQMQEDLQLYSTEAIVLREQIQLDRTAVVVTIAASDALAAEFEAYNQVLQQTVVAGQLPTATVPAFTMNTQGPLPVEMFDLSDGQMRFVQVGTASQIDNNRCFVAHQSFFRELDVNIIYITGLALNLRAGTVVSADWRYGDQLVHSTSWVAPQSINGQCFALELRPSNAPFLPGNWTAVLFVNGEVSNTVSFTIIGSA